MREKSFPNRSPRTDREEWSPRPAESLSPRPGSRMLVIPPLSADPLRLAEESIENLKRAHSPGTVKTSKRKRKTGRKCGPTGGGRLK